MPEPLPSPLANAGWGWFHRLCGFCGFFDEYLALNRLSRLTNSRCPFADPECPEQERREEVAWITDPETRRLQHHGARALLGLPCDRGCPRTTPLPEIRESLIEKIKARYRIEDMAERLTEMRWRGHKGMGRCPFHPDRSPSFSVDTERQKWHCFAGCGHGDVVDFYRLAEERGLSVG